MFSFKKLGIAAGTGILSLSAALFAGNMFDGWNMETDMQGRVIKMVVDNPQMPMGIEKQISIDIGSDMSVGGGSVIFTNGAQRPMNAREALAYWEYGHGPRSLWGYYESVGKLAALTSNDKIPNDWAGRVVRFVSRANTEVVGTQVLTNDADRYGIKVGDACCGQTYFTAAGVNKLQTLK